MKRLRSGQDMQIDLEVNGQEQRLPANVELAFYRIVQEALTNTIRHAQASRALVHFTFSDTWVEIIIEDNGQGFTIPKQIDAFASSGHFGLLGMSERADLVEANLNISAEPETGTKVSVTYVIDNKHLREL